MAGSLGSLVIELAANSARLSSDMGKAVGIVERGSKTMATALKFLGGTAIVGSLRGVITKAIEIGDNLDKAAVKAGIGGQAMSELAHAASMSDVELSGLSNSLRFMQKNLSEAATGAKAPRESLAALGLTLNDLKGLAADRQFELLGDRISQLRDPADRARAATELFGRAGADLLPLFEKGAAGIRAAREEAQRLGKSLTGEAIAKLADADKSIKQLKASWEGFATSLTATVAPALSAVLNLLSGQEIKESAASRISGLQLAIKRLEAPNQFKLSDGQIAERERRLAVLKKELASIRNAELNRTIPSGAASTGSEAPGYLEAEKKASDELVEVTTRNIRELEDVWKGYYDSLDGLTQTSADKQNQQMAEITAALEMQLNDERISPEVYAERWSDAFDRIYGSLEEVKTANKSLEDSYDPYIEEITGFWDGLPDRAQEGSIRAYDAVNEFLFEPTLDGIKGLGKALVDTLKRSVIDGLTDTLFASKKSGGFGFGDAITGIGKSLFGFADGGSFQVGGSGGTDSQLVAFKASPNERVTVTKPGQGMGSPVVNVTINAPNSTQEAATIMRQTFPVILQQAIQGAMAKWRDEASRGAI